MKWSRNTVTHYQSEGTQHFQGDIMNRKILTVFAVMVILVGTSIAAIAKNNHRSLTAGAVFAMTNAADGNQVVVFSRDGRGLLTEVGSISTGGNGSGGDLDPLGSQGSLVLTKDKRFLLAVNAGSNSVSVFRIKPKGLELTDTVPSGGDVPVSVAVYHKLVYVLNTGSPNITGFFLNNRGELISLPDSTRDLGTGGFAQVGFDPRGKNLVVTDRDENEILVFSMGWNGLPSLLPVTSASNGLAPFGFIFDKKGHLLVSEAGSGAVTSYGINNDGTLQIISPSVANEQLATCWITGNNKGYVFTANTGSQTISAYKGDRQGHVELLDNTAGFGDRPIDMDISVNNRFLYALDPSLGTIDMFEINTDGSLTDLGTIDGGFSIFAQGIAVR